MEVSFQAVMDGSTGNVHLREMEFVSTRAMPQSELQLTRNFDGSTEGSQQFRHVLFNELLPPALELDWMESSIGNSTTYARAVE